MELTTEETEISDEIETVSVRFGNSYRNYKFDNFLDIFHIMKLTKAKRKNLNLCCRFLNLKMKWFLRIYQQHAHHLKLYPTIHIMIYPPRRKITYLK